MRIAFFRSPPEGSAKPARGKRGEANGGTVCVANVIVPGEMLSEMIEALREGLAENLDAPARSTRRSAEHRARIRLRQITPSNAQLRKLAAKRRPPSAYFEGDVERPW